MMATAREPIATARELIAPDQARSLRRWNRFLAGTHFFQFCLMIAVSSTATLFEVIVPTIRPILENGKFKGVEQTQAVLFEIPLAWFIASFFLMSSIAHASAGWALRDRYEGFLARGMNPLRWVEYAFSSTVMIVAIAYLSYITDFPALIAIAGCNVAMILFGWSMEAANEGRAKPDWKHFIFGCIAGIVPWIAIFSILWAYGAQPDLPSNLGIPAFVYVIIGSLFVAYFMADASGVIGKHGTPGAAGLMYERLAAIAQGKVGHTPLQGV